MEEYLRKLSAYVAEHPPDIHSDDVHTILDALFWAYCETAGPVNENVQQGYDTLQARLKKGYEVKGAGAQKAVAPLDSKSTR